MSKDNERTNKGFWMINLNYKKYATSSGTVFIICCHTGSKFLVPKYVLFHMTSIAFNLKEAVEFYDTSEGESSSILGT